MSSWTGARRATAVLLIGTLAACAAPPTARPTVTIQRTANGVAHVHANDIESAAFGIAYAHAQDNVCQTADYLVTVRGQRSRHLGGAATSTLGLRTLRNEQIDLFVAAHIDDARLERAHRAASAEAQSLARGYVTGYNRFLADQAGKLPAPCGGAAWVEPMTLAEFRRIGELNAVLAGSAAFADAMLAARPPGAGAAMADAEVAAPGLGDPPLASNAWAFGADTSANGRGVLLGNPHFPWRGVNRFWQVHVTVPGSLDVMGVAIGNAPGVVIGFNKDVAWSHTVSTGRRFTVHELKLAAGDPGSYLVDGRPEKMTSREVSIGVRSADGSIVEKRQTLWSSRYGPLIVVPRLNLGWTATTAYALQDANTGNVRSTDAALAFGRASNVHEVRKALRQLGTAWVNTIAADRHGDVLYADASVVPDVDAAHLERCAPSEGARRLFASAGIVVLDGSRSDCDWRRDPVSAVPGLTPIERLPSVVRRDWVQNSNDSFVYTHPEQRFAGISPLVGGGRVDNARTRSSLIEIAQLLGRGKVTPQALQQQLFANLNLYGRLVMPDLLAACPGAPDGGAREGCTALRGWNLTSDLDARGAHLFREFWREARGIANVHRVPFDPARPVETPLGLRMNDPAVAPKVWEALAKAVAAVRGAGIALEATLGSVQRPAITAEPIPLHGGEPYEGVLNMMSARAQPAIGPRGVQIDYGTSYVQAVGFDERGPRAQALLVYGQSTDPASPHVADQLRLYSRKVWPVLPFHPEEVARERVGPVLELRR
jgi:acyl-homoserine-lactone acylase